jgi:DNA polymerase III epsilon subunit-like protein
MSNRAMIDLETMSTRDDAAVISIGAVIFDEIQIIESLHLPLTMKGLRGHIDPETILWWINQSKAAQDQTFCNERLLPHMAAFDLWQLCEKYHVETFWANDPHFDFVILRNWWRRYREDAPIMAPIGVELQPLIDRAFPFKYNSPRSYKTVVELAKKYGFTDAMYDDAKGEFTAHNAVEDAAAQARVVIACERWFTFGTEQAAETILLPPIEDEVVDSSWRDGTKA